jgi:hypothetical protein
MRELYGEGLAVHAGPESCVRVREGAGEALTGVRAGWAIEPRKLNKVRGADAVTLGGRQHRLWRYRESRSDPARSENLCTYGVSMRENREVPRLLVLRGGS